MVTASTTVTLNTSRLGEFAAKMRKPLMAMVEITNRCNMACPICFSGSHHGAEDVTLAEIRVRIQNLLNIGGPIPLQISGGEPTLHPELPEVIRYAKKMGFRNIELISNGLRLCREQGYLSSLVDCGLTSVYLQFDGVSPNTYRQLRGMDMSEIRSRSISIIRQAGICCTLAVAVVRGVNDHELGDIVNFAVRNIDTVRAINFQAAARFTGRFDVPDHCQGYGLAELTERIEEQSNIPPGGFRTDILGHPQCNAMSLVYVIDDGFEPLFNHISDDTLTRFLGSNTREIIADLFDGKEKFARKHILNPSAWKALLEASAIFGRSKKLSAILKAQHILLFAKSFMERNGLDESRIHQCNYGIATTDGVYSFCAYNNFHRFSKGNP